jgi:hypothetical protein
MGTGTTPGFDTTPGIGTTPGRGACSGGRPTAVAAPGCSKGGVTDGIPEPPEIDEPQPTTTKADKPAAVSTTALRLNNIATSPPNSADPLVIIWACKRILVTQKLADRVVRYYIFMTSDFVPQF